MIDKILIANRGEIACRIMKTCRKLGIRTVAVYSKVDARAKHVHLADEAIGIGPAPAADSYLNIERIITAAQQTGVDAIHPGYGFLAENADFARACSEAGLIFIGPSAEAIEAMGNKRAAKLLMQEHGVPTVPGYSGADQSDEALQTAAQEVGFPLMVKAAAGGGGKGMRIVYEADSLPDALASARREAQQSFGSAELILERAILRPRHIEVQVFGDQHGHVIHLGERECSIQRRHQKVIEEAPAPGITPELREQIGQAAVAAAQAVNYSNAGTVEFLMDENGAFYFLEMNTRIQVEHPVTELVTGQDLIAWQIQVAEGEPLPLTQEQVVLSGHAIEARIYAEDPANEFLPVTGEIALWQEPKGVRVDSGLNPQDEISIYYDPMIAKVIAYGADRKTAVRKLRRALEQTVLFGLTNNLGYLRDIVGHRAFEAGELHTSFLAEHLPEWTPQGNHLTAMVAVAVASYLQAQDNNPSIHYWRNSPNRPLIYRFRKPMSVDIHLVPDGAQFLLSVVEKGAAPEPLTAESDNIMVVRSVRRTDTAIAFESELRTEETSSIEFNKLALVAQDGRWWVQTPKRIVQVETESLLPKPKSASDAGGSLRAPMPGVVLEVMVDEGDMVTKGQALMKLEAMKMEHTIRSAAEGTVKAIYFTAGDQVTAEAQLLVIESL